MATRVYYDEWYTAACDYVHQILDLQAIVVVAAPFCGTEKNRLDYLIALLLDNWGGGGGGSTGFWSLTGNTGTIDGTNWHGTNDTAPVNWKQNGQKAGRIFHTTRATHFGYQAGNAAAGTFDNVYIGYQAALLNVQNANVVIGSQALSTGTAVHHSVVIGWGAAQAFNGNYIVAIGAESLQSATGERCTALGRPAGNPHTTGIDCVYIGFEAGYDPVIAGNNNLTGSYNTIIGMRALVGGNFDSVIALNGIGTGSNQFVVGGAFDSYASLHSWVTQARFIYNSAGTAEIDMFFRTSTPEGAQAAPRGSKAFVDDGTNGREFKKSSGTGNTGWEEMTASGRGDLLAYAALGGAIIAEPVAGTMYQLVQNISLVDQQFKCVAVWLTAPATITGVKWFQVTQGAYTADQYNGVGLYTYAAGTLTLVASSTDDGNIWKAAAGAFTNKAFSATYAAAPGIYFVAALYNNSAQTTAPVLGGMANLVNSGVFNGDFTNSGKLMGTLAAQNALPTPQVSSGLGSSGGAFYLGLY